MNDQSLDLDHIFKYHAPKGDQAERYVRIREAAKEFAIVVSEFSLPSREYDEAIKHIEAAVMWANAGIARNE